MSDASHHCKGNPDISFPPRGAGNRWRSTTWISATRSIAAEKTEPGGLRISISSPSFAGLHSGAAVPGPLARAARGGAGVHLLVALALELLVENAGCKKTDLSAHDHVHTVPGPSRRQGVTY